MYINTTKQTNCMIMLHDRVAWWFCMMISFHIFFRRNKNHCLHTIMNFRRVKSNHLPFTNLQWMLSTYFTKQTHKSIVCRFCMMALLMHAQIFMQCLSLLLVFPLWFLRKREEARTMLMTRSWSAIIFICTYMFRNFRPSLMLLGWRTSYHHSPTPIAR